MTNPTKTPDPQAIQKKVARSRNDPRETQASIDWLVRTMRANFSGRINKDIFKPTNRTGEGIGKMYFFVYDPKHKATLPYYDKFPLVIPIEIYQDGFLGLNLHYLPPMARARLLDQLMALTRRSGTAKAYMQLSYEMLGQVAKVKGYDACIKRYLTSHIKTKLMKVEEDYWESAAMLPVQEFVGASKTKIWGKRK